MSDESIAPGNIGWIDLSVGNADQVRDFYGAVVGWQPDPVDMSGYSDYQMLRPSTGEPVAGICHAQGCNADMPPVWLIYIVVPDLDAALAKCEELGGEVIAGPKEMGESRYAVIKDPAGAMCALYQE